MESHSILYRLAGITAVLLLLIANPITVYGLQSSQNIVPSFGEIRYTPFFGKGVNYLSLNHSYATSDSILRRDFARFQQDGVHYISLSLYWYRLEGDTRGSYKDGFLNNVKRVINIANEYNLKVLVTIHTLWGDDSTWCTPDYVIDPVSGKNIGLAIVRSVSMKQAFIDMFTHTVNYLKGTPGIWAWALLNEPWLGQSSDKEPFIILMQDMSNIIHKYDPGKLTTVRFPYSLFVSNWGWDQRIFNCLDFISLHCYGGYVDDYNLSQSFKDTLTTDVNGCVSRGKQVWITEFGQKEDNNERQRIQYNTKIAFFKTLDLTGYMAWLWVGENSYFGFSGRNICGSADGTPRPAYYELIK